MDDVQYLRSQIAKRKRDKAITLLCHVGVFAIIFAGLTL